MKQQLHEVQVSYRHPATENDKLKITNSQEAYEAFKSIWNQDTISMYEEFYVIFLDHAHHILGYRLIGRGTTSFCMVDTKIILTIGLLCHSSVLLLAHNHPSGQGYPSNADKKLTAKIQQGAKLFDIKVLDHLILTCEGYFSFQDEGLLEST